jgi:hypothetical protein
MDLIEQLYNNITNKTLTARSTFTSKGHTVASTHLHNIGLIIKKPTGRALIVR